MNHGQSFMALALGRLSAFRVAFSFLFISFLKEHGVGWGKYTDVYRYIHTLATRERTEGRKGREGRVWLVLKLR